jgi:hypothetical protein
MRQQRQTVGCQLSIIRYVGRARATEVNFVLMYFMWGIACFFFLNMCACIYLCGATRCGHLGGGKKQRKKRKREKTDAHTSSEKKMAPLLIEIAHRLTVFIGKGGTHRDTHTTTLFWVLFLMSLRFETKKPI